MVINATTIEEQLASLTRAIEGLTKHAQEQDAQIARLINKADNIDASHVMGKQVEAHDEYTDLDAGSIDGWEQLEQEFLNHLQHTVDCQHGRAYKYRQWKEEPVVNYINRWRNLILNCKGRLSEASAIEMCIQGMHWELCYILQAIKPKTFGELATRAHEIEMSFNCKEEEYSVDLNDDDGDATP
ncbi:UNVERIFIED_CONTAM: hypothetical protein Scaly_0859200 [Sesamum calycinum]|uniref:Retrotransposon gag domain-containing protein n=1 Tax=Sesamum calycinum TaxID=2727403 RepID=A0AAW2QVD7_9LAMI